MSKIKTIAVGVVKGVPMEKIKACMKLDDLADEILDRLYDGKAVPLQKVRELNKLFYETFPERQDGGEFTEGEGPKGETSDGVHFDFGEAIRIVKSGGKVTREGWNGKGQYIELATELSYRTADKAVLNANHNDIGSKAIAFCGTSGTQIGWLASQADMLAEDWRRAET